MSGVSKLYNIIKLIVGLAALLMSFEYFFFIVAWPENSFYYIGDIVFWFLFNAFMIGESFISLTEVDK